MTTIKATRHGFHLTGGTGLPLAPDALLNAAPDIAGSVRLGPGAPGFIAQDAGGHVALGTDTPLPDPGDTWQATIAVTSLTWFRDAPAGPEAIGRMGFERPLKIQVTYDLELGHWSGHAAAPLAERLQADGFGLMGGPGADVLDASALPLPMPGGVTLDGRGGDDRLTGTLASDVIRGGAGQDRIADAGGRNQLIGGAGDDHVTLGPWSAGSDARGGAGDDRLVSSNGADRLDGGLGDDRIEGGRGDDILRGGPGNDTLAGGDGADTFIFRTTHSGQDVVTDFDPDADRLILRGPGNDDAALTVGEGGVWIGWGDQPERIFLDGITPADDTDWLILP
ncbi:hypothetical protein HMH01_07380 [Halovulum dunhuangense]|uniref:Hemolysin type calcium-binding protein n=1 Tax=Halovulum dunhuangense TaxID=1505036 RepID=A0A849L1Y0_9RHOB|nr:calcium-binding protein [Halovulum dunhuangense]NNU80259.1 hypothetical protein [Halovulum dunhuangense]